MVRKIMLTPAQASAVEIMLDGGDLTAAEDVVRLSLQEGPPLRRLRSLVVSPGTAETIAAVLNDWSNAEDEVAHDHGTAPEMRPFAQRAAAALANLRVKVLAAGREAEAARDVASGPQEQRNDDYRLSQYGIGPMALPRYKK